jgi:hypothetical protein
MNGLKKEPPVLKKDYTGLVINNRFVISFDHFTEKHNDPMWKVNFLEFTNIKNCHYCNGDINWSEYQSINFQKSQAYNLDRKDNNLGYTKDNCVVCCGRCNLSKGDRFTYDNWKQIGEVIKSWR